MAELSAGSLSHFFLHSLVRGGKGMLCDSIIQNLANWVFYQGPGQDKFPAGVASPTTSTEPPTILVSPVKRRKPTRTDSQSEIKASTPDEVVWHLPDEDIIGTLYVPCCTHISNGSSSRLCQDLEVTGVRPLQCIFDPG